MYAVLTPLGRVSDVLVAQRGVAKAIILQLTILNVCQAVHKFSREGGCPRYRLYWFFFLSA